MAAGGMPYGYNPADYDENGNYIGAGSQQQAPAPPPPDNYIPGSTYIPPSQAAPAPAPPPPQEISSLPPVDYQPGSTYVPPSAQPVSPPIVQPQDYVPLPDASAGHTYNDGSLGGVATGQSKYVAPGFMPSAGSGGYTSQGYRPAPPAPGQSFGDWLGGTLGQFLFPSQDAAAADNRTGFTKTGVGGGAAGEGGVGGVGLSTKAGAPVPVRTGVRTGGGMRPGDSPMAAERAAPFLETPQGYYSVGDAAASLPSRNGAIGVGGAQTAESGLVANEAALVRARAAARGAVEAPVRSPGRAPSGGGAAGMQRGMPGEWSPWRTGSGNASVGLPEAPLSPVSTMIEGVTPFPKPGISPPVKLPGVVVPRGATQPWNGNLGSYGLSNLGSAPLPVKAATAFIGASPIMLHLVGDQLRQQQAQQQAQQPALLRQAARSLGKPVPTGFSKSTPPKGAGVMAQEPAPGFLDQLWHGGQQFVQDHLPARSSAPAPQPAPATVLSPTQSAQSRSSASTPIRSLGLMTNQDLRDIAMVDVNGKLTDKGRGYLTSIGAMDGAGKLVEGAPGVKPGGGGKSEWYWFDWNAEKAPSSPGQPVAASPASGASAPSTGGNPSGRSSSSAHPSTQRASGSSSRPSSGYGTRYSSGGNSRGGYAPSPRAMGGRTDASGGSVDWHDLLKDFDGDGRVTSKDIRKAKMMAMAMRGKRAKYGMPGGKRGSVFARGQSPQRQAVLGNLSTAFGRQVGGWPEGMPPMPGRK